MALAIYPFALTSLTRLKSRLGITDSSQDTVLTQLINECTDVIQGFCARRFIETTYENEAYDGGDGLRTSLMLNNFPVSSITRLQERAGTPDNPTWNDVSAANYEPVNGQPAIVGVRAAFVTLTGIIKTYFYLTYGVNNYRVSYVAGYKINFDNEGNLLLHNLPTDLTGACEQLCAAMYNIRKNAGVESESLGAHSVTWGDMLGGDATSDKLGTSQAAKTIYRYKRPF